MTSKLLYVCIGEREGTKEAERGLMSNGWSERGRGGGREGGREGGGEGGRWKRESLALTREWSSKLHNLILRPAVSNSAPSALQHKLSMP